METLKDLQKAQQMFALIFSGYSKVPPWIMRHHEQDVSLRTHFSPAPVLTGSMHLYTVLFLVLTVFLTVDGQFIKVANYGDLKCNDTDSYTVFANGKCQTLTASGISSSNINQCSSNAVTTSVYYGGSCSGKASNQASTFRSYSTEISCLASFLYTRNSSSDGLTVTFLGTSCQGKVYSILVVPGLLTSNSTKCSSSACVKTNYGTSTRFVCGNSTSLPGYVQSLNSATGIMFSGMINFLDTQSTTFNLNTSEHSENFWDENGRQR
ncbi:hypothetical protein PROFUN_16436 [Planoprotostelium fungivorum]|uniref:Uncharacterized protein n=1 Tax=Planoprotostelium fungivorum TaxID=1890364 RepID=A0A2P6MQQ9_9EUKA|nr:hypothetical protein PROFUN_16436 [Planoprotostelium fungivorum]